MTTLVAQASEPPGFPGDDDAVAPRFFDPAQTLISQYANSPILVALVDALGLNLDWQARADAFFASVWDIEAAVGFGLDIWGRIVGVTRALYIAEGEYLGFAEATDAFTFGSGIWYGGTRITSNFRLTDEAYRRVILAKAAMNITDGSIPSINAILRALFLGGGNVWVRDNNDMTMTFVFDEAPSAVDLAIATQSGVLPRPIGVAMNVEAP